MEESEQRQKFGVGFEAGKVPTFAVTGVWSGPTPDSTAVVAHVYVEQVSLPNQLLYDYESTEEGPVRVRLDTEEAVSRNDVTREVQAELVMSPEAAINVGTWLVESGLLARERRQ